MRISTVAALGTLQRLFAAIRILRAPIGVALLANFALSTPHQVLELYLILARGRPETWPQIIAAGVMLAMLAMFITYAGRCLARASRDPVAEGRQPRNRILWHLPLVLGLLPLLGAATGLHRALDSALTPEARAAVETIEALKSEPRVKAAIEALSASADRAIDPGKLNFKQINDRIDLTITPVIRKLPENAEALRVSIYAAIASLAVAALLLVLFYSRRRSARFLMAKAWVFHPAVTGGVAVVFFTLTVLFAAQHLNAGGTQGFDFTAIPRAAGTLALVNLSLIAILFAASIISRWSDRTRIPLLTLLIVGALLLSLNNLNDNHGVRLVASPPDELAARKIGVTSSTVPILNDAFNAWFKARPAEYVRRFEGRPYPVYVVAAQGGGMYAANLGGLTLARLYDRCPAIRHHLFAISGVSGGSVGSGFLAALLNDPAHAPRADTCDMHADTGPLETRLSTLLQSDFLAPVASSFLFSDFVQRFLPYPISALDRARAFEAGLEQSWQRIVGGASNSLAAPFWRHWKPSGNAPMLLLNATVVETGHQLAIAPVRYRYGDQASVFEFKTLREAAQLSDDQDVPLSTAMSLSARFPVVMPAGLVTTRSKSFHLVDGGVFENSGVEAARFIVESLARRHCPIDTLNYSHCGSTSPGRPTFAFRLIALTEFDELRDAYATDGDPAHGAQGLNEFLGSVWAMLNTRVARGDLAVARQPELRPGYPHAPTTIPTVRISLNHRLYALPLGWQLSRQVQEVIAAQIGDPLQCVRGGDTDFDETMALVGMLEQGIDLVAAGEQRRVPRTFPAYYVSPFVAMLKKLQRNHCALFDALAGDGVAPASMSTASGASR